MTEQKKRPTFLTVLCILSFIGSGLSILSSLWGLLFSRGMQAVSGMAEEGFSEAMTEIESEAPEMGGFMGNLLGGAMKAMEHYTLITTVSLLVAITGLIGVIMMWKLKKIGFYVYTGAQVVGIIVPLVVIGGLVGGMTLFGAVFTIAFIIMYAVNLKAME
jgi:hypothetical protein